MANGNPVILGTTDSSTRTTQINGSTASTQETLRVQNLSGTAVAAGSVGGTGLTAGSLGGTGLIAESFAGSAVVARCIDAGDRPRFATAVLGDVQGGFGVEGANRRGRFPEAGVAGRAVNAIAVDGVSRAGFGVRGLTLSNNFRNSAGVLGVGSSGHGVVGIATQPLTPIVPPPPFVPVGPLFAGLFFGNVEVSGDFTVFGSKSAVVRHPDGTFRRLYCVEAPESWFEDVGSAELVKGRATVAFEKAFAPLIRRDEYHVFLTPEGDCRGLYVASKSEAGFEVRELQGGTASLRFSWRVMARRADVEPNRLAPTQPGERPEGFDTVAVAPKPPKRGDDGRLAASLRELEAAKPQKPKAASKAAAAKPKAR